jgi:L-alanine-DL-glutamate epimerase-like enolase superfamily enzyme
MRIDQIEMRQVAMPLLHPRKTASHEATAVHAVFVRLESDGVSAWGEAAPLSDPTYSPRSGRCQHFANTARQETSHRLVPSRTGKA